MDIINIPKYECLRLIGGGGFGKVYLCVNNKNDHVAVKVIERGKYDDVVSNEIQIMKQLDHPNIIKFIDYFKDDVNHYIVCEYAHNGEFYNYVLNHIDNSFVLHYFRQIIEALEYMNSCGVYHCDLKFENILLDDNFNIKICDFGISSTNIISNIPKGTPLYTAPENYNCKDHDCSKSDIWSIGIILFIMLTGDIPIEDKANINDPLFIKIMQNNFNDSPWDLFRSVFGKDLCTKILKINPDIRLNISQIKDHPYYIGSDVDTNNIMPVEIMSYMEGRKEFNIQEKELYLNNIEIVYACENDKPTHKPKNIDKLIDSNNSILITSSETDNRLIEVIEYSLQCKNFIIETHEKIIHAKNDKLSFVTSIEMYKGNKLLSLIRVDGSIIYFKKIFMMLKNIIQ